MTALAIHFREKGSCDGKLRSRQMTRSPEQIHFVPLCTDNCSREKTTKRDLSEPLSVRSRLAIKVLTEGSGGRVERDGSYSVWQQRGTIKTSNQRNSKTIAQNAPLAVRDETLSSQVVVRVCAWLDHQPRTEQQQGSFRDDRPSLTRPRFDPNRL
jgi:hypothetical protein